MPYVLNGITLKQGKGFTIADGTQFPPNWLRLSTDQEKQNLGIVWRDPPPKPTPPPPTKDQLYQQSANVRWEIQDGGITVTFDVDPLLVVPIPTDDQTQRFLTAARVKITENPNYVIESYKIGPNQYVSLTADMITLISERVEKHIQDCFTANKLVDAKIEDGTYTTNEDLRDAVEWNDVKAASGNIETAKTDKYNESITIKDSLVANLSDPTTEAAVVYISMLDDRLLELEQEINSASTQQQLDAIDFNFPVFGG